MYVVPAATLPIVLLTEPTTAFDGSTKLTRTLTLSASSPADVLRRMTPKLALEPPAGL